MTDALATKLKHLPTRSGVYKHVDAEGGVLYVGKAKNLRSRVRSYFHEGRLRSGRLRVLVEKIEDVEVIVTDTEAEALILENNLIKQLQPRYNVNLRDDKTYPYICIKNERFPRVFPTRRVQKDGSKYFGPYTDVKSMKQVLGVIRSIFKLRTCKLNLHPEVIAGGKYDVCLEYHIEKCAGPCEGLQAEADYDRTIAQVEKLLNGHTEELIGLLKDDMREQAAAMDYEAAAERRDQIDALRTYSEKQKIVSQDFVDRDLFALRLDEEAGIGCGVLFKVREGKIIGRQHKYLRRIEGRTEADLVLAFVEDYYTGANFFPEEVWLSADPDASPTDDTAPLAQLLREKRGKHVPIKVPQRGEKASLMRMASANAQLLLDEWKLQQIKRGEERIPHAVRALKRDLRLDKLPRRIECFDISHLGGTETVASLVVFKDGEPRKKSYRTFKIRSLEEGEVDDFQAMREVIRRRYRRVVEENGPWPDLVVIDGGKGQLSSAVEALKETEAYGKFAAVGLAKRLEEVFVPGDTDPVLIPRDSAALQLLQRVRNEAHRFAVTYQRKRRKKKTLRSELLDIKGIGPKTAQELLKAFGSTWRVKEADRAALAEVVGPAAAERVRDFYR